MATPEQLAEAGKATRFGSERDPGLAARYGSENANMHSSDPENANKPWSIQKAMRRLAAQEIEFDDNGKFDDKIRGKHTRAQAGALKALNKMLQGDARFTEICLDRIDGRVEQTINMKDLNAVLTADDDILDQIIETGKLPEK